MAKTFIYGLWHVRMKLCENFGKVDLGYLKASSGPPECIISDETEDAEVTWHKFKKNFHLPQDEFRPLLEKK